MSNTERNEANSWLFAIGHVYQGSSAAVSKFIEAGVAEDEQLGSWAKYKPEEQWATKEEGWVVAGGRRSKSASDMALFEIYYRTIVTTRRSA